jgi:D-glycero-alpha-D-manno-heptose-7-phosphate kinase
MEGPGRMSLNRQSPRSVVNAVAPVRICDNGDWTDTWFAEQGKIFNIGVYPFAEVQVQVFSLGALEERIIGVPKDLAFEVMIYSEAPSGASTGTSAAVTVALIGALDCMTTGRMTAHEIALRALYIETELLGQQYGIQD